MKDCPTCWSMRSITCGTVRVCRWCLAERAATATAKTPTRAPLRPAPKTPTRVNPNERPPASRPYRCGGCGANGHAIHHCPERRPAP